MLQRYKLNFEDTNIAIIFSKSVVSHKSETKDVRSSLGKLLTPDSPHQRATNSLLHAALDHLLDDERGDVVGVGVHAEAGIEAQLLGQLVSDARTTAAADHLVAQALGLHQLDEVGQVLDMNVLLRDGLRDNQRVGLELDAAGDELLVGHL